MTSPGPFQFAGGPSPSKVIYQRLNDYRRRRKLVFNHEIEISLPLGDIPQNFPVSEPTVYTVRSQLSSFLNQDFLQKYILEGEFTGLSCHSRIDCDNVVAFLPSGRLMITVDRCTYQSLGLIGRPSSVKQLKSNRYDIIIDLRASSFQPGSAQFKRLLWCLQDRTEPCFLVVAFTRDGRPEEIEFPSEAVAERLNLVTSSSVFDQIPVPSCLNHNADSEHTNEVKLELFQWFGALSCSLEKVLRDSSSKSQTYASGFSFEQLAFDAESNNCCTKRLSGFIPESVIEEWIEFARTLVDSGICKWAAISVFGFADAPVSWVSTTSKTNKFTLHHFEYEGDNHYVLVIQAERAYMQFAASGALDDDHVL